MKHALAVLGLAALLAAPAAASALDHDRRDRHDPYVQGRAYGAYSHGYGQGYGQGYGSTYAGVSISETEHQSYIRTGDAAHGYGAAYGAGYGYGPYYPYGPHGPVVTYRRHESYGYGYHGSAYQARSWGGYGYGYHNPYRPYGYERRHESRYGYGEPRPRPGYRDEWGYNDDRHPYRWDRGGHYRYDRDCACQVYLRDD